MPPPLRPMRQPLPVGTAHRTRNRRSVQHVGAAVAAVEDHSEQLVGSIRLEEKTER